MDKQIHVATGIYWLNDVNIEGPSTLTNTCTKRVINVMLPICMLGGTDIVKL